MKPPRLRPRHAFVALAVAVVAVGPGCLPPAGLGMGPAGVAPHGFGGGGSAGIAMGNKRETFQAEAAFTARFVRNFALETGLAYTLLRVESRPGHEMVGHSVLPYVRPTLIVGGAYLGVALSGLAAGGGGGGSSYGLIGVRAGYGGDNWSLYAEWLLHGSGVVGGLHASSTQYRAGGDYEWTLGERTRLGAVLEVADVDESISEDNERYQSHGVAVMFKLRVRILDQLK